MSRVAWFRATTPDSSAILDETAPIIDALRLTHDIDVVTEAEAHDFVWKHFRQPYDLCVYEIGSTPAHAFMGAYVNHYPGILAPRGLGAELGSDSAAASGAELESESGSDPDALTIGLLDAARRDLVERAVQRARQADAPVRVLQEANPRRILRHADAVVALEWPPVDGTPTAALLGMAASKPVIVLEIESTAAWPALDPQTWRRRGFSTEAPIVISLDPRDEEHSLMLALKRLASDVALRAALGTAGHAWWRAHATIDHAVDAWEAMLTRPVPTSVPLRPTADHSAGLRATLDEFGVGVDFL
jgi:hypothetical protein